MQNGKLPRDMFAALSAALPSSEQELLIHIANEDSDLEVAPFGDGSAAERFARVRSEAAGAAAGALRELTPEAALYPDLIKRSLTIRTRPLIERIGYGRLSWVVGASAGGSNRSKRRLQEYFDACALWYAADSLMRLVSAEDADLANALRNNASFEVTRRLLPTDTRFAWVSRLILTTAAEEVQKVEAWRIILPEITVDAVAEYFDFLRTASYKQALTQQHAAGAKGRGLMRALSLEAGSLSLEPFQDLMMSTRPETQPFVAFPGRQISAPLSAREAVLATEQAFFELVKLRLPDDASSKLFERVVTRTLDLVGPQHLRALPAPLPKSLAIDIPASDDPGEVDFALYQQDQCLLVGEAKCYRIPRASHTVLHAFTDQVGKAARQLRKRLDALMAKASLTAADGSYNYQEERTYGLAVTLHHYATAIYNRSTMIEADAEYGDIHVLPIHQAILVMQTVRDVPDLLAYLKFRTIVREEDFSIFDEADVLLQFVKLGGAQADEALRDYLAQLPKGQAPILLPHYVETADALLLDRPTNRSTWRQQYRLLSRPNTELLETGTVFKPT